MIEPKIGAFTWASLNYAERRQGERRGKDRRDGERGQLVCLAARAISLGVSEEVFVNGNGERWAAFIPSMKETARQIYREVKNAKGYLEGFYLERYPRDASYRGDET